MALSLLLILASLTVASAQSTCQATAVATMVNSPWQTGDKYAAQYEVTVTNTGSCALSGAQVQFQLPGSSLIDTHWELNLVSGQTYTVNMYPTMAVGASSRAGIILKNYPNAQVPASITVTLSTTCPSSCYAAASSTPKTTTKLTSTAKPTPTTAAPTTVAPTAAPTRVVPTAAPTTVAPTAAPTPVATTTAPTPAPPTPNSGSCKAEVSVSQKLYGRSWMENDITVQNTGTCVITKVLVSVAIPPNAEVIEYNNVNQQTGELLAIPNPMASGSSQVGGYIVLNSARTPLVEVASLECSC